MEKHTTVRRLDSCAAQFRSRFVFKHFLGYRPNVILELQYHESHNGKLPMDDIGGTVKNVVFRQFKANKVTINIAAEFCRASNKYVPSIKSLFQQTVSFVGETFVGENLCFCLR